MTPKDIDLCHEAALVWEIFARTQDRINTDWRNILRACPDQPRPEEVGR